jgi:hypothetical protein
VVFIGDESPVWAGVVGWLDRLPTGWGLVSS